MNKQDRCIPHYIQNTIDCGREVQIKDKLHSGERIMRKEIKHISIGIQESVLWNLNMFES